MLQRFFSQDEIKRITRNIINLPTLPTVVAKMIELVDNPKTTASSLGKLISSDQVLTAKVLKLANSAFYAFPRKIATVNLAIVVLGFDMIKNLVLSVSVIDRFSKESDRGFDVMKFWEHSVGCGVAGRMVAGEYGYRVSGEVFTSGLLHDIGKLILREYLKVEFQEIVEIVEERDISFIEAEREVLGVTHTEIGGWLGEKWNLPGQLVEAIRTHHHPEEAQKAPELTALVHFSDVLCRFSEVGYGGDDVVPPLDEGASHLLRLHTLDSGEVDMEYYKGKLLSEMEKAEIFMNLIQGSDGIQDKR